MANTLSMSGFSRYGAESLKRMSEDADFLKVYLKMQGRLYKFPATVSLEFYSQMSNVQFIGTEAQWGNLGCTVATGQNGITFVDKSGNTHTYYEISQIENIDHVPKVWQITSENIQYVKEQLSNSNALSDKNAPILTMILNSSDIYSDAVDCMRTLNVPNDKQQVFYNNYAKALALVCAGRLEVNSTQSYNINIDTDYFKELKSEVEKLTFLSYVGRTARKSLAALEKIVVDYNKQRRIENEIRRMEKLDNTAEAEHRAERISDRSSERATDQFTDKIDDSVQSGNTENRADDHAENSEYGKNNNDAVLERGEELGEQQSDNALRSDSDKRNVPTDSGDGTGAVDGGRTNWSVRSGMDGDDEKGISGTDRDTSISAQVPERSEGSGYDSGEISERADNTVRKSQSRAENDTGENVLDSRGAEFEEYSNEGESSDAVYSGNTGKVKLSEEEFSNVVHDAFNEAYTKYGENSLLKGNAKTLYDRLANRVVKEHFESHIIRKCLEQEPFKSYYGGISKVDGTYFNRNLYQIEKEIEENIHAKTEEILTNKSNIVSNAVVTADMYRTDLAREISDTALTAIPLDDSVNDELISRAKENGYIFTGTIVVSDTAIDVATAKKNFELVTNGEFFNMLGVNIENYNVKSIEANKLLTSEELSIMKTVVNDYRADLKRKADIIVTDEENIDNKSLIDSVDKQAELIQDIKRGSGFEKGKLRINKYYTENQPTNKEFAEFLKHEYGIGGHSADEPIAFVDYDAKGIEFTLANKNGRMSDEKFSFTWTEVAAATAKLIDEGSYYTENELEIDDFNDIDTQAIKENLESINPEQSEFVQQVINDVAENNAFDTVSIYQLKDEYKEYLFETLERLEKNGKEPLCIDAYNMVYTEDLEPYQAITTETTLENVWERFNIHRPSDYTGHSLSISDVVVLKEQGIETAYFVDSIGFKELPHFFVNLNALEKASVEVSNEINSTNENSAESIDDTVSDEAIDDIVIEKPKKFGNSYAHRLYKLFTEQFPDIADGSHVHEMYGKEYVEDVENDAYEPLSVEHLGGDLYGFMYWYVQNGDLMRDPDFTFILDHENQELIIQEYQLDGSVYGTMYERTCDEDGNYDKNLLAALNENFLEILKRGAANGMALSKYTTNDGKEVVVNEKIDIELPVEEEENPLDELAEILKTDMSAEYRETLNEFSEKHNLGELNIYPPKSEYGNDWIIREKYPDETELTIAVIYNYEGGTFNNDTLRTALESWEEAFSIEKDEYKQGLIKEALQRNNGQRNPLPVVQKLPDIGYAEKDKDKFIDNINALEELKRLEDAAANGNALYKIEDKEDVNYGSDDISLNPYVTKTASDNILRKYSGWGGLSKILDERFKQYSNMRNELKSLVSESEYKQILRSTLTAFYTPQDVIDAMYKAVANMDMPMNARILEPSCATGNFFARLPSRYRNAQITGVEIDETTSKIAKYLNNHKDNVTILNMGFEKTNFDNDSFDLVIGNVPFSENKMIDVEYQNDLKIHDAFFRKAIDKVAKGGIVAFITSSGTLDKKNPKIREMFAEKADLIGAIRLPNNVFGGTNATSDIIFLQKRETPLQPLAPKPDWCYVAPVEMDKEGKNETVTEYINSYFVKNPQMILGKMEQTTFQDRKTCVPFENVNLTDQLDEAIKNISATFNVEKQERKNKALKLEAWGKNFTFQVKDDKIYYRKNNDMEEFVPKVAKSKIPNTIEKMKALIGLRDITRELINKQSTNVTDAELMPLRNTLNEKYDAFVDTYKTNLASPDTKKLFFDDIDYPLLYTLENKTEKEVDGNKIIEYSKSPIFHERTVNANVEITSVDSAEEALQVSLNMKGKVDIPYMALLMQHMYPDNDVEVTAQLICDDMLEKGLIFEDPSKMVIGRAYSGIVDRAEYLSGNVRHKLAIAEDKAAKEPERFSRNVEALTSVIPENIPAEDISFRLGVAWVDTEDYEEFLHELSGRNNYNRAKHKITYLSANGSYDIENSGRGQYYLHNENKKYGISDEWNMYHIAENVMNQRNIVVYDKTEDGSHIKNRNNTRAANRCADLMQKEFKKWLFKDEKRKEKYVERYNNIFNSIVGRKYDGSNITINGINNTMRLRPHQLNCIARTVYGGNTLAAHVVGAGKSAVMFSSIMKKKQLGLINKACVVVPKAIVEQTADEWRKWYPDAKLLTFSSADIGDEKKRLFFASKVATGNYDGVIMSIEQFDKIPCTPEFIEEHKQKQIDELEKLKNKEIRDNNGVATKSVKALEKMIEKYEKELDALLATRSKARGKDNLLYFEELGFDYLVVDEAHHYKNGSFFTKMTNLSGVGSRMTGRSADMHLKTDYLNNTYGNGHILFATGTPVTNSMQELYTMTRYLRPDILKETNTYFFDNWAAAFGEIVTKDVQGLSGQLEPKSSFSRFTNLPELMGTYKEFADIQSQKKLNLPRPELKGGKPQVVSVEPSKEQKEYIKIIAERAQAVHLGSPLPRANGREDGMCVLSQEARLLGLGNKMVKALYEREQRELPYDFEENEPSKIDACIQKVKEIYDSRNEIGDDKAVQLIFSDIAVNKGEGKFSAYDYIKQELINKGIPENEIIFAPKADAKDKSDIFKKINNGSYRVVIASTGTLGTGANIQENLYALHHLDIPHRPSDFEQREGRILRFGNKHDSVEIFNYVTKGTFDSMFYENVLNKARFISQILDDENPARVCEDADEKVLNYGEIMAVAQDKAELKELFEKNNQLTELKLAYSRYQGETIEIRHNIPILERNCQMLDERIHLLETDLNNAPSELKITTSEGEELVETKDINSYLSKLIDNVNDKTKATSDASFKVANFNVTYTPPQYEEDVPKLKVTGALQYTIEISKNRLAGEIDSTLSNKLRTLFSKGLEKRIEEAKADYENKKLNLEQSKERITLPFESLDLLEQTQKEVEELTERVYEIQGKENSDNKEDMADENVDDDDMSVGCM